MNSPITNELKLSIWVPLPVLNHENQQGNLNPEVKQSDKDCGTSRYESANLIIFAGHVSAFHRGKVHVLIDANH